MKNIKVFTVLISLLTALVLCSTSCGTTGAEIPNNTKNDEAIYEVLELGGYDSSDGGTHAVDYELCTLDSEIKNQYKITAQEEVTITFDGVEYTGTYRNSTVQSLTTYVSHRYKGDDVMFKINAETGELTDLFFLDGLASEVTVTEEYCRRLADSIADDYVKDLSQYKVEVKTDGLLRLYTYYREINGFKTLDRFGVTIDGDGTVLSFGSDMIGSFDGVESVPFVSTKAVSAVDEKLNTIYGNIESEWDYDIQNTYLIRLNDGSFGLIYTINNEFTVVNGETTRVGGSMIDLLVKIK